MKPVIQQLSQSGLALICSAVLTLLLAGCQSTPKPGSSSLAAVVITNSSQTEIHDALLQVFLEHDFTVYRDEPTRISFEREGTTKERLLYGGFGESVWMRVEIRIEPYQLDNRLVRLDLLTVRHKDDEFFEDSHKVKPWRKQYYRDLLAEVKKACEP